ncbi:MAG: hypothetical protein JNK58_12795 [Phycisphaerae bacterium]|nr:hypothetical protein [Phycisphaerae bacterium]
MRARMMIGVVAGVLMMLGGCAESKTHEYAFDVSPTVGMLAVDIENFRGIVQVRADHRVQRATVTASGSASDESSKKAKAALDETWVDATLEEDGARGVLKVRTGTRAENPEAQWMNVTVLVPRCGGVRIDNREGYVEVVGTSGGTMITNRLGAVEFRTDKPMIDPVTITTTDGDVYYQVPAGSTGAFDLQSLDGAVTYRDRVQGSDRAYVAPGSYQARLNGGENAIQMRTNRGNVNVWVDKDPVALTRLFKRDLPDPQDMWFLQGSRRHTRNLPDDHVEVTRQQQTSNPYHDRY